MLLTGGVLHAKDGSVKIVCLNEHCLAALIGGRLIGGSEAIESEISDFSKFETQHTPATSRFSNSTLFHDSIDHVISLVCSLDSFVNLFHVDIEHVDLSLLEISGSVANNFDII